MTVYKAVKAEAKGAADAAVALIKGGTVDTGGKTTKDSQAGRDVPSVLLTPVAITADKVKDVVADGFVKAEEICTTPEAKTACTKYGVS
jgi:D-xylose transport system substrate-binding protein